MKHCNVKHLQGSAPEKGISTNNVRIQTHLIFEFVQICIRMYPMYAEPHLWVSEESQEQRAQGGDFSSFFFLFFLHNESRDARASTVLESDSVMYECIWEWPVLAVH